MGLIELVLALLVLFGGYLIMLIIVLDEDALALRRFRTILAVLLSVMVCYAGSVTVELYKAQQAKQVAMTKPAVFNADDLPFIPNMEAGIIKEK